MLVIFYIKTMFISQDPSKALKIARSFSFQVSAFNWINYSDKKTGKLLTIVSIKAFSKTISQDK